METIEVKTRLNTSKIKSEIKELVKLQRFLKNQRKTEKIVGKREMLPCEATYKAQDNSHELRKMYAAYSLIRCKDYSTVENHYPEENHPLNEFNFEINELVKKYKIIEEIK